MARDQLFISYSHADSKWLERLKKHLGQSIAGGLDVWDDNRIRAGADWKKEISEALRRAKVALLLISPDFLASNFIANNELPQLLDAAKKEGVKVTWIAVSTAIVPDKIAKYQAAHDPKTAVDRRSKPSWNKELAAISRVLQQAMEEESPSLSPQRVPSAPISVDAKISSVSATTGSDGGYVLEIEVDLNLIGRAVQVAWLKFEWCDLDVDVISAFDDDDEADAAQSPIEARPPFLLERNESYVMRFFISAVWRSRGRGRIVAKADNKEIRSGWFPMKPPRVLDLNKLK